MTYRDYVTWDQIPVNGIFRAWAGPARTEGSKPLVRVDHETCRDAETREVYVFSDLTYQEPRFTLGPK